MVRLPSGRFTPARGPEQIAEELVGKRLRGEVPGTFAGVERLHERSASLGIGGRKLEGGGLRRSRSEEQEGSQQQNGPFGHGGYSLLQWRRRGSLGSGRPVHIMGWLRMAEARRLFPKQGE